MDIQGYLAKMKKIQDNLLKFLESSNDFEEDLRKFTTFLTKQHLQNEILKDFLNMISKISMNHHRSEYFIKKIESILAFLQNDIKSSLSNTSLFNVFRDNKRILFFLLKNKFLNLDEYVYNQLIIKNGYINYFRPELIFYHTKKYNNDPVFEENREKGEDCDYICELIRNDSIEEFIIYLSKANLQLEETYIKSFESCFETNYYLLKKESMSLIEYAVFFGSIQILKYLQLNNVSLSSSLWIYAIHSNNPEVIQFLEDNHVLPYDKSYKECFLESVKCYHNDIAYYIQNNLLEKSIKIDDLQSELVEYYNFNFLSDVIGNEKFFNCLCKYDYISLMNIIIKNLNVNKAINDIYLIII